jgi:hypothetical protein
MSPRVQSSREKRRKLISDSTSGDDHHFDEQNILPAHLSVRNANLMSSPKRIAKAIEANGKKHRFRATPILTVQDFLSRVALTVRKKDFQRLACLFFS